MSKIKNSQLSKKINLGRSILPGGEELEKLSESKGEESREQREVRGND